MRENGEEKISFRNIFLNSFHEFNVQCAHTERNLVRLLHQHVTLLRLKEGRIAPSAYDDSSLIFGMLRSQCEANAALNARDSSSL